LVTATDSLSTIILALHPSCMIPYRNRVNLPPEPNSHVGGAGPNSVFGMLDVLRTLEEETQPLSERPTLRKPVYNAWCAYYNVYCSTFKPSSHPVLLHTRITSRQPSVYRRSQKCNKSCRGATFWRRPRSCAANYKHHVPRPSYVAKFGVFFFFFEYAYHGVSIPIGRRN